MENHITLRKPTLADYPQMAALIQEEEEHLWVFPSASFPLMVSDIQERAKRRDFTIVLEENIIIGFANLYEEKGNLYIGNFAIASTHRRKGYGKNLMIILIEKARKTYQAKTLMISVISGNDIAKKLYQELGFIQSSMEVFKTYTDEYLTVFHMKMDL